VSCSVVCSAVAYLLLCGLQCRHVHGLVRFLCDNLLCTWALVFITCFSH
jgi:hypothetical protein